MLKFRLTFFVAISSVFGYAMAGAGAGMIWWKLLLMWVGGMLITGSANVFNQIWEKDYDRLMQRTQNRPMPRGILNNTEALIYAVLLGVAGVFLVGVLFNLPAALLGIIGILLYAFVYTPVKRISAACVFIGAIPGSLPPLIGWVAYTGYIGTEGMILMAFQFFWQFPHFWAIAWLLDEDYQKAGFKMLPSALGKVRFSAWLIVIYTVCLIPLPFFAHYADMTGLWGTVALALAGILFALPSIRLFKTLEVKYARMLMFASFLYLPVIQLIFLLA